MAEDNPTKSGEAKGAEKAGGWSGLLIELVRGFILLRDVIGYAMPGVVFLGLVVLADRNNRLTALKNAYQFSAWGTVALAIIACYTVGNVLAAVAYGLLDLGKWISHRVRGEKKKKKGSAVAEMKNTARILLVRIRYPELLTELERRSIVNMFRGAAGVGLLGGAAFYFKQTPLWMLLVAGGLMLLISFLLTAPRHLRIMLLATVRAAELADKARKEEKKETPSDKGVLAALKDFLNQRFK
jgi:hypothetical protein